MSFLSFGLGFVGTFCELRRTLRKTISQATRETKPNKYEENRSADHTIADSIDHLVREANDGDVVAILAHLPVPPLQVLVGHCFVKARIHSWVSRMLETGTLLDVGTLDKRIRNAKLVSSVILFNFD